MAKIEISQLRNYISFTEKKSTYSIIEGMDIIILLRMYT